MIRFDGMRRAVLGAAINIANNPRNPLAFLFKAILGPDIPSTRELRTRQIQARTPIDQFKHDLTVYRETLKEWNTQLERLTREEGKFDPLITPAQVKEINELEESLKVQENQLKKLAKQNTISTLPIPKIPGISSIKPGEKVDKEAKGPDIDQLKSLTESVIAQRNLKIKMESIDLKSMLNSIVDQYQYIELLGEYSIALSNDEDTTAIEEKLSEFLEHTCVSSLDEKYIPDFNAEITKFEEEVNLEDIEVGEIDEEGEIDDFAWGPPTSTEYDELSYDSDTAGDEKVRKPSSMSKIRAPLTWNHCETLVKNINRQLAERQKGNQNITDGTTTGETGSDIDY